MASGPVVGCWVFLAGTMPALAKYTNREKSKGRSLRTPPGNPSPPHRRRYLLVTPARIFKLQPFRHVKGDFCRTPSIGFNGHRYSNLFDGGASSFNPSLPSLRPPFCSTLILILSFSLSFFRSLQSPRSPHDENRYRNRCELPVVGSKRGGKKEFASRFVFFLLPFDRRYSRESGTEATPTDARIYAR